MKKRLRPIVTPKSIELYYYRELRKLAESMKKEVRENLLPLIQITTTNDSVSSLLLGLEQFKQKFENLEMFSEKVAGEVVSKTNMYSREKFMKNVNSAVGVDLTRTLKEEGLQDILALKKQGQKTLIKSIPEEFLKSVEVTITNGVTNGKSYKQIERELLGIKNISSTFGKLNNRIKTIVRTEVASINSNINKERYLNAGITKAIWQTSGDERTRPCHKARDGKEFVLSEGLYSSCDGLTLLPGQDYSCRCVSIPIFED